MTKKPTKGSDPKRSGYSRGPIGHRAKGGSYPNGITSSIPTIKMSKKAEKTFLQARKDHAEDKTTLLKNINDLDKLME